MEFRFGIHNIYSTFPHWSVSVKITKSKIAMLGASAGSYNVYLSLN